MNVNKPTTDEEFKQLVQDLQEAPGYTMPMAYGIGIGRTDKSGDLIEVFYQFPNFRTSIGTAAIMAYVLGWDGTTGFMPVTFEQLGEILSFFAPYENDANFHGNIEALRDMRTAFLHNPSDGSVQVVVTFIIDVAHKPTTVPEAYLRLQIVSNRLAKPDEISVDGLFGLLRNIAWTSDGPIPFEDLREAQISARVHGQTLVVYAVDKFPRMLDYTAPPGVRIVNAANVRLGAYLGIGTTVMTAGAINFDAGVEGPNMVEGRVSKGCWVDAHSDVGGGASLMGTLSGGGTEEVNLGRHTLVGANAGLGISLGDNCKVEAGLYLTMHTPVTELDASGEELRTAKAIEMAGVHGLVFYRHGTTGRVEARPNKEPVELNEELHKN